MAVLALGQFEIRYQVDALHLADPAGCGDGNAALCAGGPIRLGLGIALHFEYETRPVSHPEPVRLAALDSLRRCGADFLDVQMFQGLAGMGRLHGGQCQQECKAKAGRPGAWQFPGWRRRLSRPRVMVSVCE